MHLFYSSNFQLDTYSRAGHKLEAAIEQLGIDVLGKIALDSGLSTGGFTDCLLQYGASFVYGVDVGYGQVRGYKICPPLLVKLSCLFVSYVILTITERRKLWLNLFSLIKKDAVNVLNMVKNSRTSVISLLFLSTWHNVLILEINNIQHLRYNTCASRAMLILWFS